MSVGQQMSVGQHCVRPARELRVTHLHGIEVEFANQSRISGFVELCVSRNHELCAERLTSHVYVKSDSTP